MTTLYVNRDDSEWSSTLSAVGGRNDTACDAVEVATTTMRELMEAHGPPEYLKVDIEGSDGVVLDELARLGAAFPLPEYLSFELNAMAWLDAVRGLGYDAFKLVAQNHHRRRGSKLYSSGELPESATNVVTGDRAWTTDAGLLRRTIRVACRVHDDASGVPEFLEKPPVFVGHDFAVLRAVFPVEARDLGQWYDVHCRLPSR